MPEKKRIVINGVGSGALAWASLVVCGQREVWRRDQLYWCNKLKTASVFRVQRPGILSGSCIAGAVTILLFPMNQEQATAFAYDWVDSWNAHDLDRIMAHYADELDFRSPLIQQLGGDAGGTLRSKAALPAYFATGLNRYPGLRFALHQVLLGVQSVVLCYRSINDWPAAEYMELNAQGQVQRVRAHYAAPVAGG